MKHNFVPFCFLPINKPVGPTSHDMVDEIRRLLPRSVKVGHTGTLDPFAGGVLILALGKATKFADFVHQVSKRYRAEIRLGEMTDTLDPTGTVVQRLPVPELTREVLDAAARKYTGVVAQMPPAYSAKKINGKKSYELARQGQQPQLKAKTIHIHQITLDVIDEKTLSLDVLCSTGTYVRALARDIGEALGTCGYLTMLERTAIGSVSVDNCVVPEELSPDNLGEFTIPVSEILPQFPEVVLPNAAYTFFVDGRPFVSRDQAYPQQFLGVFKRDNGQIAAIYRCSFDAERGIVRPKQQCWLIPDLQ